MPSSDPFFLHDYARDIEAKGTFQIKREIPCNDRTAYLHFNCSPTTDVGNTLKLLYKLIFSGADAKYEMGFAAIRGKLEVATQFSVRLAIAANYAGKEKKQKRLISLWVNPQKDILKFKKFTAGTLLSRQHNLSEWVNAKIQKLTKATQRNEERLNALHTLAQFNMRPWLILRGIVGNSSGYPWDIFTTELFLYNHGEWNSRPYRRNEPEPFLDLSSSDSE